MDIDVKSLFYLFSAGNFFILLFFSAYIILNKVKRPIINIFIVAKVLMFILWLLFALRNVIPGFYSIVFANVFLIFAVFYEVYCIAFAKKGFERKQFIRLNLIPIFISLLFIAFVSASENTRVIIMSFMITLIFMAGGFFSVFISSKTKILRLTGYFYFGVALLYLLRALWALYFENATLFYSNNIQILSYIFLFLVSFTGAIVLLLILKEQDEERIEKDNLKLRELIINKDKFFSIIAHDLRSPLSTLTQLGELLLIKQDELDDVQKKELTEAIYQGSKRTFNLLDNLLKWASSNSGLMKYEPKQIDLKKIADENIKLFTLKAEAKKIKLTCLIQNDLIVYADYNMINTVVRNLISNALKFTHVSGQIKVISKETKDNTYTIGVVDTGIGMSQNVIAKVFEIDSSITTLGTNNEKGFGLGLKLCKEFINKNTGTIWIDSKKNVGSTIWISLPKTNIKS